jgi:hypothetical protein
MGVPSKDERMMISSDEVRLELAGEDRIAESKLLGYPALKAKYEQVVENIVWGRRDPSGNRPGTGDPTSSKAIKLMSCREIKDWLDVVEAVMRIIGYRKRVLLEIRQQHLPQSTGGRPGWVSHVIEEMGKRIYPADGKKILPQDRYVRRLWQEIVSLTVRVAKLKRVL